MSAAEAKKEKPEKPAKPKKVKAEAAPEAAPAAPAPAAPPAPRTPADPRLKVMKKFTGRYLPKGPLRDRLKVLMTRWESGEDHGGVTYDELKALHKDWIAARAKKRPQPTQA